MAKNFIIINSLSSGGAERQVSLLLQSLPNFHLILLNGDIHYRIRECYRFNNKAEALAQCI